MKELGINVVLGVLLSIPIILWAYLPTTGASIPLLVVVLSSVVAAIRALFKKKPKENESNK